MKKNLTLLVLAIFFALSAVAQNDTNTLAKKIKSDSTLNIDLIELSEKLNESEQERKKDSLLKAQLEQELQTVRESDTKSREEYEEKIKSLKTKDSIRSANQLARISILKTQTIGFPVAPFKDTLYSIYSNIGPFSPLERAENINRKIRNIYKNETFYADSLIVTDTFGFSNISYRNEIITSVSDVDAMWYGTTRGKLANDWKAMIQEEIESEISENSLKNILIKIGGILLVLAGIIFLIYLVNKLFKWIEIQINSKLLPRLKPLNIKNYELLSPDRISVLIHWTQRVIKYFVYFIIVYISLPIFLSIFPHTQSWADMLIGWILSPVKKIFFGFINYLPNLITIIIIYIATRYLVRFIGFLANEVKDEKLKLGSFYPDWALPTFNIVRVLLYAFMFVVIFPYLPGSDSPIFKGVSVFIGILFSFGSSSAISNMVAGLVITYMRPYKVGDRIKIGEHVGDVIEKTLLNTRLRTIKNEEITIPNSFVLSGQTINYSNSAADKGLILHTTITIGYDINWRQMHEALLDAASKTNLVLKDPKPFVLQTSLDDFYVSYQLNAYTKEAAKQAIIYSELHANILDSCFEKGIEILSPHYRSERDGNPLAVPEKYLSDHFTPNPETEKKTRKEKIISDKLNLLTLNNLFVDKYFRQLIQLPVYLYTE